MAQTHHQRELQRADDGTANLRRPGGGGQARLQAHGRVRKRAGQHGFRLAAPRESVFKARHCKAAHGCQRERDARVGHPREEALVHEGGFLGGAGVCREALRQRRLNQRMHQRAAQAPRQRVAARFNAAAHLRQHHAGAGAAHGHAEAQEPCADKGSGERNAHAAPWLHAPAPSAATFRCFLPPDTWARATAQASGASDAAQQRWAARGRHGQRTLARAAANLSGATTLMRPRLRALVPTAAMNILSIIKRCISICSRTPARQRRPRGVCAAPRLRAALRGGAHLVHDGVGLEDARLVEGDAENQAAGARERALRCHRQRLGKRHGSRPREARR